MITLRRMENAREIIEHVGVDNVASEFGIKRHAVLAQVNTGLLPPSWFASLELLAGQPLPRKLFRWKGVTAGG